MPYTWTGTAYVDDRGDTVPDADVHAALGTIQAAASGQIAALSQRVANGDLRPTIWQRNVAGVIRDASLSAAALAAGGWDNLDDYEDDIADRLTQQFTYLGQMREQVPSLSPAQIAARSLLYVGAVGTIFAAVSRTVARSQEGAQEVRNILDDGAPHCFPAGTQIATPSGSMSIEQVQTGDFVLTRQGSRRVIKTWAREYQGRLVLLGAGGYEVSCTPNHPFATHRGWQRADALRPGEDCLVRLDDCPDALNAQVRFPDADYGIAADGQVGILRTVSMLLGTLPLGKWLKVRMTMPVVSVKLQDEPPNTDINDELGFDQRRGLVGDSQCVQHRAQPSLRLAWLDAVKALAPLYQAAEVCAAFGRVLVPGADLGSHFRTVHRIGLAHMALSGAMNLSGIHLGQQTEPQPGRLVAYLDRGQVQDFSDRGFAFLRIVRAQILHHCSSPDRTSAMGLRAGKWLQVAQGALSAILAETGTEAQVLVGQRSSAPLALARLASDIPSGRIALLNQPACAAGLRMLLTRFAALRALFHRQRHALCPCSDMSPQTVYNLTVEGAHHYFANGFLVHNCDECPDLTGQGWTDPDEMPLPGERECVGNCRCTLEYRTVPAEEAVA